MTNGLSKLELARMDIDLYKYTTTLSSGAIALIAAFLRSLIELPGHEISLKYAAYGFFSCIIGSILGYLTTASICQDLDNITSNAKFFGYVCALVTLLGLATGVTSLFIFVISNIP